MIVVTQQQNILFVAILTNKIIKQRIFIVELQYSTI